MNSENIKVLIFLNGDVVISNIEEVVADLGEPDCKLHSPFLIKKTVTDSIFLESWLSDYTSQNVMMVHSDKILTIIEPKKTILDKYLNLNKK